MKKLLSVKKITLAPLLMLATNIRYAPTQSPGAMWTTQIAAEMRDRRATGLRTAGPARRAGVRPRRRKAQKVSLTSGGE